jgi:hypothetical protein
MNDPTIFVDNSYSAQNIIEDPIAECYLLLYLFVVKLRICKIIRFTTNVLISKRNC